MICDKSLEIWVCVANTLIYSFLLLLHLFATYLVYISRKTFHPFFVMFFLPFIFLYAVCDLLPIITDIGKRSGLPAFHVAQLLSSNLLTVTYRTVTPIVVSFLIERLYATVHCGTYEGSRPAVFPFLLPLGVLLATADDLLLYSRTITLDTEQYSLLAVEIFILVLLCILYIVNRRLVARNAGSGMRLSARYQLSENVRVLRLVITVVVLDGLITVINILGGLLVGVSSSFDLPACQSQPNYFLMYVAVNAMSLSLSASITAAIVYGHPALTRASSRYLCFTRKETSDTRITNVLGEDLILKSASSSQDYFQQLYNQWN